MKSRWRVRLNSVQLWVSVPDMARTLEVHEDDGPEYRSIYDVIVLNVSKLVISQASDGAKAIPRGAEAQIPMSSKSNESPASKMKVDLSSISVFIVPAHGNRQ